ncbi:MULTISPECIES: acyltransferase family protein [Pseudomonas]|uniref:Acyltransferase family protein n=4 Tax=Pseudomonas lactis TaxID=1615674 RepID=A0ABS9FY02_9PSED|nr:MULTISPECIES: acyltransferase [Pseudomonas]MBI6975147.1 acyltransferase [Pseudomonas lactis]MCF4975036.1 acyltransferase family protein [Pseudomonas lactis]MCF5004299.1 acyltransferase family protein [Pseudomonas lactis]MCF5008653.1 acyltransferase family protein [Pseudomonas lactis]MCF5015272.1 acyltransferase family protein [Pseudomonas lactis]
MAHSKNINYMPRVDHLRFYAASLVILVHTYIVSGGAESKNFFMFMIMYGSTGVTLFLVLSGFLFTLIAEGGKKELKYSSFIQNRILRVFPLFLVVAFTAMAIHRDTATFNDFLSIFLFSNIESSPTMKFLGPTWTIAVELQFYLIFPFIMAFVRNFGRRYVFGLLVFWILWRTLILYQVNPMSGAAVDNNFYYMTIIGRLDQFLIGIIFAFIYIDYKKYFASFPVLVLSILGVFSMTYWLPNIGAWYSPWPDKSIIGLLEPIAWGFLVISYLSSDFTKLTFVSGIVAALGELSYSAYITHGLVIDAVIKNNLWITFTDGQNTNAILNGLLIIIPAVLAVSWLSFNFIEKPFLSLRKAYTTK